jgi:hypothetical protein
MIWLKSLASILQSVPLKSDGSFVSVTKEVGVPEDVEVRSCKRFFLLDACLQNESQPNMTLGNLDLVYFHTTLANKN